MNSGIRFSVALIVVIMVLIGFYYASLDDGATEGDGGSATPQISVEGAETTDSTPVATPREAEVERRPAEPERPVRLVDETDATDDETAVDADGTTGGDFDEFLVDSTPDSTPDADAAGESAGTEAPDATNGPDVTDGDESSDAMESDAVESVDEVDESVADEEDASSTTDADVTETVESVVERVEQSRPETRRPVGTARPARNPRAAGVGIHRLASIDQDASLANAALRVLAEAEAPGVIDGPDGTVWMPLPAGDNTAFLDDAIVGRVRGQGPQLVLLRGDSDHAIDLAGKVAGTEVTGSDSIGNWGVSFRLTSGALDAVRNATRGFQRQPVAWVGGGRILVLDRPLIPISGRGRIPTIFGTEIDASAVARLLEAEASPAADSPAGSGSSGAANGVNNVVRGAGSLPPDQYTEYVVKPGDNFESIALAWFGDRNKHSLIAEANPFKESSRLTIGEILRLPPKNTELRVEIPSRGSAGGPQTYVIRSGDTLGKIAQAAYGKASLWTKIYEANKATIGPDPANLKVGTTLEIPE